MRERTERNQGGRDNRGEPGRERIERNQGERERIESNQREREN